MEWDPSRFAASGNNAHLEKRKFSCEMGWIISGFEPKIIILKQWMGIGRQAEVHEMEEKVEEQGA